MLRTILALLSSLYFAAVAPAQHDRELDTPTGYVVLSGITAATVNSTIAQGYRLTDIEVRTVSPITFVATFVSNSGVYASGFWWYYGQTPAQLSSLLTTNQARLTDLEVYDDGAGNTLCAAVMVPNTGTNARSWWWYYNTTTANISTQVNANNARIYDLDEYVINGVTYYSALMIANTGSEARSWWYYYNQTSAAIGSLINTNQARIIDLDRRSNGNFNVVMQRDPSPTSWYWFTGLTLAQVIPTLENYGQRPIDVDSYTDLLGTRRYDVIGIKNTDDLAASILAQMHNRTDGTMGAYLKRINGSVLSAFNEGTQFEPASTMKTLHHTHAMRQVHLGNVSLATNLTTFLNYSPTNASCPVDSNPIQEPLQNVLTLMMQNSDNRRTQAVTAYFTQNSINATAAALGMTGTSLNHRLGCGADAILNPNRITLADLGALHQQVANGYLGTWRDTFYSLMLHSVNDLSLASVIDQEAAAIGGLSAATIGSFKSMARMAHKGGNYSLNNGGPQFYHRAEFGWLSLPFIAGGNLTDREYAFGAFVNDASVDANASAAIYTDALPELFRSQVHAALLTWTTALATTVAVGNGCGFPAATLAAPTLPRLGATVSHGLTNGYASALALLALGFDGAQWNGVPLPASMVPFGSAAGCFAYNDIAATVTAFTNAAGSASAQIGIPNNAGLLGLVYYTQYYTLGPTVYRTSNGLRSRIGL